MGCWQLGQTCNTNKEQCIKIMNTALSTATTEARCSGLAEYVTCVQNDVKDCQDKSSDQYAINIQDLHCSKADPCVDMVLQCQKSIVSLGSDGSSSKAENTPPLLSDCASQKPLDYCGAYRQASSCVREVRSACGDKLTVDNTLTNMDNTIAELCDPGQ
ncbi:hypothetical protein ACOMHN_058196 [Nucella lapillus]